MGFPRLPTGVYALILILMLLFAYLITGPAHQFFVKVQSNLGSFYEPRDFQREEYIKSQEEKNR
jgi:hypothetical protein